MEDIALCFALTSDRKVVADMLNGQRRAGLPDAWVDWFERVWDRCEAVRIERRIMWQLGEEVDFSVPFHATYGSVVL